MLFIDLAHTQRPLPFTNRLMMMTEITTAMIKMKLLKCISAKDVLTGGKKYKKINVGVVGPVLKIDEWVSVKQDPDPGRYLVKLKCSHKYHSIHKLDRAYPCDKVNIAYFDAINGWHFTSFERKDKETYVTYWRKIPE